MAATRNQYFLSSREFLPEKAFPVDGVEEKVAAKDPVKKVATKKVHGTRNLLGVEKVVKNKTVKKGKK